MSHEAAMKAIDGAIYCAEENLEEATRSAGDALREANTAKDKADKAQRELDRRRSIAAKYRDELVQLRASKRALEGSGS